MNNDESARSRKKLDVINNSLLPGPSSNYRLIPTLVFFLGRELEKWENEVAAKSRFLGGPGPTKRFAGAARVDSIKESFQLLCMLVPASPVPLERMVREAGLDLVLQSIVDALYNDNDWQALGLESEAREMLPLVTGATAAAAAAAAK